MGFISNHRGLTLDFCSNKLFWEKHFSLFFFLFDRRRFSTNEKIWTRCWLNFDWFFQVHELQTKLTTARESIQQLKDQLNQSDAERRQLDQEKATYKLQLDELRRQFDDTAHERDRSKTALETSNYERSNMEKIRLVRWNRSFFFRFVFFFFLNFYLDFKHTNR